MLLAGMQWLQQMQPGLPRDSAGQSEPGAEQRPVGEGAGPFDLGLWGRLRDRFADSFLWVMSPLILPVRTLFIVDDRISSLIFYNMTIYWFYH